MKHKLLLVLACVLSLAILLPACGLFSGSDLEPEKDITFTQEAPEIEAKGSDLERKEIISFTQQALEIEAQRAELMQYFATARTKLGAFAQRTIIERSFYTGILPNTYKYVPPSGLEGMESLQGELSLLACPQSLQSVKDTFDSIYSSEIQLYQSQRESDKQYKDTKGSESYLGSSPETFIWPELTKDNLDYWEQLAKAGSDTVPSAYYLRELEGRWTQLQKLRRDTYIRWYEVLREHGVDPKEHGFTGPTASGTPTIPPGTTQPADEPEDYYGYLQTYLETFNIANRRYLTPYEDYLRSQAAPWLTLFQIQQRLGAIPGNASGVTSWLDYLRPFEVSGNIWLLGQQAQNLFRTLINTPVEQREPLGYAYYYEGDKLDDLQSLIRLALHSGLGPSASRLADRIPSEHQQWLTAKKADPGHTADDFLDYVRERYNLGRYGF